MNIIAQEAKKRQVIVICENKKGNPFDIALQVAEIMHATV